MLYSVCTHNVFVSTCVVSAWLARVGVGVVFFVHFVVTNARLVFYPSAFYIYSVLEYMMLL